MIAKIETQILWRGKSDGTAWFHPKATRTKNSIFLTAQRISGSDVYHHVHFTESRDGGQTWTARQPIPGLERKVLGGGFEDLICDVVPEYHAPTNSILCLGSDVHYLDEKLTKPFTDRWIRYFVRRADETWTAPRKLEFDHPAATQTMSAGCGQRFTLPSGDVLVPVCMGAEQTPRAVTTLLCGFNGETLAVKGHGRILHYAVKRGLLEPSLARAAGQFWMTIRAEDNRGYFSASPDGLAWQDIRPYTFDDGSQLITYTTQQHWITHKDSLWLSYTRQDAANNHIFRWRTPTWLAQFDTASKRLIKSTERVAIPMDGKAYHGNFHPVNIGPNETWITNCDLLLEPQFRGDTTITRIHWNS
jgi:hypothetical protein